MSGKPPRSLKVVSATPREVEIPDLDICMLDVVIDDLLHHWRYDIVLVGTPRGLTFTVERKRQLKERRFKKNGEDSK
jgi:hypothetical protein